MAPAISVTGFVVALFLPWLAGIAFTRVLMGSTGRFSGVLEVAYGYFVGSFLATLVIRLFDALGAPLDFTLMAVGLALAGGLALWISRHSHRARQRVESSGNPAPRLSALIIALLSGLLLWRYGTLLGDMMLRPLYPWDAWMNWAPKAVVWFNNGELSDFVAPENWLQQGAAGGPYTLGNPAASTYPEMVPLIFLWHMLGAGTWDHSLLQLPWFFAAINLGLALYGHLRLAGATALLATAGSYCLLNLPFLNIHTVLAGYADLWLAAGFSLGVFALYEWEQCRENRWALLALLAALMCVQLKNPGIILALILVACLFRTGLRLSFRTELLIAGVVSVVLVTALLSGISFELQGLGTVSMATDRFQVGMFGPYELEFHSEAGAAVLQSLLSAANWHLLWYAAAVAAALGLLQFARAGRPSSLALVLLAGAVFYTVVFFFTHYYAEAVELVTLNRAVLYFLPAISFYLCLKFPGPVAREQ